MVSKPGSSDHALQADQRAFEEDLLTLSRSALRKKYKGEANSHANMKVRCKNGFELDPVWTEFRRFLEDMGPRPQSHYTIDRIDPENRKYGPGLCRWATPQEQTENRSNTIWVEFEGRKQTLAELARRFEVPYSTLYAAHAKGDTPSQLAARFGSGPHPYCPQHLTGDATAVRDWLHAFKLWRQKIPRDRRWIAEPEVYDLITTSRRLRDAGIWLERKGFFELAGEEQEEAQALLATPAGLAWQHGADRIRIALRALMDRAPKVAVRVAGSGHTFQDFIRLGDWLEKPPLSAATATDHTNVWSRNHDGE